jgi:hypothetical protein
MGAASENWPENNPPVAKPLLNDILKKHLSVNTQN